MGKTNEIFYLDVKLSLEHAGPWIPFPKNNGTVGPWFCGYTNPRRYRRGYQRVAPTELKKEAAF